MSADLSNVPKKAVHVKWAGKTIALGTFPSAEADEKCARAKALTRAWRSTMKPKPDREWVMNELERLGVRVVSGRLGRKADEDEEGGGGGGAGFDGAGGGFSGGEQQRGAPGMAGMGAGNLGGTGGQLGMPANPSNQHYEMLKLHHMNLLQELQETTMMMNMYQQQQLQQEQQRLQQQQMNVSSSSDQMAMLQGRRSSLTGGMDGLYGNGGALSQRGSLALGSASDLASLGMGQRGSLGLGGQRGSLGLGGQGGSFGLTSQRGSLGLGTVSNNFQPSQSLLNQAMHKSSGADERAEMEKKLEMLKKDIAKREEVLERQNAEVKGLSHLANGNGGLSAGQNNFMEQMAEARAAQNALAGLKRDPDEGNDHGGKRSRLGET